MMRRISNAMVWVVLISGIYILISLQSNAVSTNRGAAQSSHIADHGKDCPVCRHSGKSLPDEIGADNVSTRLAETDEPL